MSFDPKVLFGELSPETFALWQHSPITAAYLQFLDDQIAHWRELAADLVEIGHFKDGAEHEDQNIHVVRGKLAAFRQLRGISLAEIKRFYGVDSQDAEEQETGTQ
jgi:hypothetical protein